MNIATLSKHLPLVIGYVQTPPGDCLLEVVHLVESSRYHLTNLNDLVAGNGCAPNNFIPGIDFRGEVLNEHWRIMASWIEFEAFLNAAKRCLDRSWCGLGEQLGEEPSKIRTLGKAIHNLNKSIKKEEVKEIINKSNYFLLLKEAWESWGAELTDLRNYVEHEAPLGGRAFGYTQVTSDGKIIKIMIPDTIPSRNDSTPKREFTYNEQKTAEVYGQKIINELDVLVNNLLTNGEELKYYEHLQL